MSAEVDLELLYNIVHLLKFVLVRGIGNRRVLTMALVSLCLISHPLLSVHTRWPLRSLQVRVRLFEFSREPTSLSIELEPYFVIELYVRVLRNVSGGIDSAARAQG